MGSPNTRTSHPLTPYNPIDSYTPPDTIGTIGPNHYVQAVNVLYAVYDRFTGQALVSPRQINSLFAGSGLVCETRNDGTLHFALFWGHGRRVTTNNLFFLFPLSRRPYREL